jgi:hypothetical protein
MLTISTTTARPSATGLLRQALAQLGDAWKAQRNASALAGLSEREMQDVGWGQPDRWSAASTVAETPEERHARRVALRAWGVSHQKAA